MSDATRVTAVLVKFDNGTEMVMEISEGVRVADWAAHMGQAISHVLDGEEA